MNTTWKANQPENARVWFENYLVRDYQRGLANPETTNKRFVTFESMKPQCWEVILKDDDLRLKVTAKPRTQPRHDERYPAHPLSRKLYLTDETLKKIQEHRCLESAERINEIGESSISIRK